MLQVESYSDTILHNITFELKADENLIILGSNGAGKSTLAKVLCGLIPSESIKLNQTNSNQLTAKEKTKAINYIPAKLSVFDEYITTREYLELSKLYSPLSVDEAMQKLGIVSLADKPCKQLSSGEQQLTLLASALLHHATLTLFDEPTANLDPQRTRKVYQLLHANLFQNSVIITHDLTLAFRLGYKILYLLDGTIHFFGESRDFFEENNLHTIFGDSVKQADDTYVVNL